MKISIIIPFNKGTFFLEDALNSIKEQKYKEIEVILVCDHIEEELDLTLEPFHGAFELKVYHLQNKKGVAAARNYGMSMATGGYIYFLDSDDYLDDDTLVLMAASVASEPCDIIYGKIINTWFKRSTFLANLECRKKAEEEPDEDDDGENNLSQSELDNEREADTAESFQNQRTKTYHRLLSSKKGVRNISILNILIKRSLIIRNQIKFNEDILFLSDYPFLFQVLHYADTLQNVPEAIYIKRKHNDSINYPSLNQMSESRSFDEYIRAYQYTVSLPEIEFELRNILDKKLLRYYVSFFSPKLMRSANKQEVYQQFQVMQSIVQKMDQETLKKYRGYKRKLFKALKAGNFNKSVTTVQIHLGWKKLKKISRSRRALYMFLYNHFFVEKSVKDNWVFCESFFGKSYSDSPKYIYEYLAGSYPGQYKFIWVINKKNTDIPYRHSKVKRFSLRYYYYLARSKYYIFNGRQPEWVRKREGNIFLQTWHGTPLKRLVFDLEDISSATTRYKKQVYNQSRSWDYLIAPNQYSSDIFRRCFLYDKEMLETGYPRNDILHSKNKKQTADRIKEKLGIPKDKKTILYAPTWRDDEYYTKGRYKFTLQLDLTLLKEKLGKEYVILLRTHYFIADSLDVTGVEDFAFNLSKYDDIAELYLISDILITDYSSVFFDYANLRRPMLFFMYDLEKYRDILRGFYIDTEKELPGPILSTSEEVLNALQNINQIEKKYKDKYVNFYDKFCSWEDGSASKNVADRVFGLTDRN